MKNRLVEEIKSFLLTAVNNGVADTTPFFDEPLVGFAAADDALFPFYKEVVGGFHLTPTEIVADCGERWVPRTVISWVLPISEATRKSNRCENRYPSRAWAETRSHGEAVNVSLRRHLVAFLSEAGFRAVAPQLQGFWKEVSDGPYGRASSWSERHAAYAAGLGTFSLNDGLITPRGIAHRCGSVITDLYIEPTQRLYQNHLENCLYHREGTCGLCIDRCPVGALSRSGHDKVICSQYVYGEVPSKLAATYGMQQTGCGLCQTKVPCEAGIPVGNSGGQTKKAPA